MNHTFPSWAPTARWAQLGAWWTEHRAKWQDAALNVRRAFGIVWAAHPPSALAMAGCTLIGAFLPVSQAWIAKLIVDRVVTAITQQTGAQIGLRMVLPLLVLEFLLLVLKDANTQGAALPSTFCTHRSTSTSTS